jgi:hypothetical protein
VNGAAAAIPAEPANSAAAKPAANFHVALRIFSLPCEQRETTISTRFRKSVERKPHARAHGFMRQNYGICDLDLLRAALP